MLQEGASFCRDLAGASYRVQKLALLAASWESEGGKAGLQEPRPCLSKGQGTLEVTRAGRVLP